jgi:myo-inositol-1-phosphate synthase
VSDAQRKVGVAIVGLGGAVATTAVAGVELLKVGASGVEGLPLAEVADLVPYTSLVFAGWDVDGDDLAKAAHVHRVLDARQIGDGFRRAVPRRRD